MTIKLFDFAGNLHFNRDYSVDIPGNSSRVYFDTLQSAYLDKLNPNNLLLLVTLKGRDLMRCR